jgi:nucleoside-diphosphate-sugar epimerase
MKILVTGTEGYLGCLLPPLLIERGHEAIQRY